MTQRPSPTSSSKGSGESQSRGPAPPNDCPQAATRVGHGNGVGEEGREPGRHSGQGGRATEGSAYSAQVSHTPSSLLSTTHRSTHASRTRPQRRRELPCPQCTATAPPRGAWLNRTPARRRGKGDFEAFSGRGSLRGG